MMGRYKTKILYLIDRLDPGGTEKQLLLLAEGLSRNEFTPIIGVLELTDFQKYLDTSTPIVLFTTNGLPIFRSIIRWWKIYHYIYSEKFDIIQLYFPNSTILGTIAARLLRKRPYIIGTRRNLYHWVEQERLLFKFYKLTARWNDHIIANSFRVVELSKKLENISEGKISVIDNGIEVDKYLQASEKEAKRDIGLENNYPIIGMVGNWRPVKGASVFLHACADVFARYKTAQFVLAGYGSQKDELKQLAKKLRIFEHVSFIEGRTDVHNIIPAFDIAVQPSLSESFSNVLIEYMMSGKSIVATKVGDAERIIKHEEEGIIVNPDNAHELSKGILRLLDDNELAVRIGLAAKEKAEKKWSIESNIAAHETIYKSIGRKTAQ
jgi:L-malate glycosyltransferase